MNINWYPGHMKKTKESIRNSLAMVDIVYELIDARIPYSSRNPEIDNIIGEKPRLLIMSKKDLADGNGNGLWKAHFGKQGIPVVNVDSLSNEGMKDIINMSYELTAEKRKALEKKGIKNRPIRAIIIGIPNVGKSTLINSLSKRKGTKVGNKPGVTRANQWIKIKGDLELLDTPGILWPKFEEKDVGLNLAFTGAIKDELLDIETLALELIKKLNSISTDILANRYGISVEGKSPYEIMGEIGYKRGCVIKGGEIDFLKVSNILLDEFRKGQLGRITLELPSDNIKV